MDPVEFYERQFMTGELDSFDFVLAEKLGMTVAEMQTVMSNREYLQWRAFYRYRAEMERLEIAKAEADAKAKRGR